MFELHPKLQQNSAPIGRFSLSLILLGMDANYPWCLLVPERANIQEIHHLGIDDREQLMRESCHLAEVMDDMFQPDKMNVAVLGNNVSQLHMHHVARYKTDPTWPGPIWGQGDPKPYQDSELQERISKLQRALAGDDFVIAE